MMYGRKATPLTLTMLQSSIQGICVRKVLEFLQKAAVKADHNALLFLK